MSPLSYLLDAPDLAPPLAMPHAEKVAGLLAQAVGHTVYPRSLAARNGIIYALVRDEAGKKLCIVRRTANLSRDTRTFRGRSRRLTLEGEPLVIQLCPTSPVNAAALRQALPFLRPTVMGLRRSFGCGDRLGIATPAHARALRGTGIAAYFAQQSTREMKRTRRTPHKVMNDAMWGVFEEGWRDGFGADADHLKTPAEADRCIRAGFTMFTIDPSDHVDNEADSDSPETLAGKFARLPWDALEQKPQDCRRHYLGLNLSLSASVRMSLSEEQLLRAAVKYGRAVAHAAKMYRHIREKMGARPFELEVSVDETQTPTTVPEHFFVASELRRLGVVWRSLAPRFIGEFEKGVDYKGDLREFRRVFAQHVSVAEYFGGYKISIHSGSDKFSIYPIAAELAGDLLHVKTAGTSYLEALEAVARIDPGLFREILEFAVERYPEDRATYHVSARLENVPRAQDLKNEDLPALLNQDDARQVLHVTYGSVLTARNSQGRPRFRERLLAALKSNEEVHYETVEAHIRRHVRPLALL